jgi:hypothetical protein
MTHDKPSGRRMDSVLMYNAGYNHAYHGDAVPDYIPRRLASAFLRGLEHGARWHEIEERNAKAE